jgi:hypothetical protein
VNQWKLWFSIVVTHKENNSSQFRKTVLTKIIRQLLFNQKIHYYVHEPATSTSLKSDESNLHPVSPRSIFISSHLCLYVPDGSFPSGFQTNILCARCITMHATCPTHLIFLDLITLTLLSEEYTKFGSSQYVVRE